MAWTRDLGTVAADEVAAKVAQATADARGCLSDVDAARKADLLARLNAGQDVPRAELDELSRLNGKCSVKMSPEDLATIDKAADLAEAGVRIMGGHAHVTLGGSDRIEDQPEAPLKGVRQTRITVTVSVTQGTGVVTVQDSPAQQPAESLQWEERK
jgi:hypothetical protein